MKRELTGTGVTQSQSDNRRLQFSLAGMFLFATGIYVAYLLVPWHATCGLMAAILSVAGGWPVASMRAGYRRIAYTLATAAIGVAAYLVLVVPPAFIKLGPMAFLRLGPMAPIRLGGVGPDAILLMSASTILAAALLRPWILAPGPTVSIGKAIGLTYLTAALFPLMWGVVAGVIQAPAFGMLIGIFGLVLSPVVATLSLPLTIPFAAFSCFLLRKLDSWLPETDAPITMDFGTTRG